MAQIKYYVPQHNETKDDYDTFECGWGDLSDELEREWIAQALCEYLFNSRDGWEWMERSQGRTELVLITDDNEFRYTYGIDYEPIFYVSEEHHEEENVEV